MLYLGIFFKAHDESGSIAKAGYVVGLCGLMGAFSAGIRGAIIDRYGQRLPLRIIAPIYAGLIFGMATTSDYQTLLIFALLMGSTAPPINLSVRPLWKFAVSEELLRSTYALDTAFISFASVIGPVLATTIALNLSPSIALIVCGILITIGGVAISFSSLLHNWVPEVKEDTDLKLLRVPAIQALATERTIVGIGIGAFNIAVPAYAKLEGVPGNAALVLSALALSNFSGGLFVGIRLRHVSPLKGYLRNYKFYLLAVLPLALTSPEHSMIFIAAFMGFAIGIQQVFFWEITELVRPRGTAVQALGWLWTFEGTAIAFGSAVSGVLIEAFGAQFSLLLTTFSVMLGYTVIWASQKKFQPSHI